MHFLEKLWKMLGEIKILNLLQQKEEETTWYQNHMIILESFHRKCVSNKNLKK